MGSRSKVIIMESSYQTCAEAVEHAFAAFPLAIEGKSVVVKVNAIRACDPDQLGHRDPSGAAQGGHR